MADLVASDPLVSCPWKMPFGAPVLSDGLEIAIDGMSLRAIARDLSARGFATVRGGRWTAAQVSATLRRGGG
jgi:hypothetical protein